MSLPAQIKDKINRRFRTLVAHIRDRQEAYFAAHGRYFQGIKTHAVLPKGELDEELPPDTTRKPTDQAESWNDVGINLPANMPMALAIDVYDGPRGKGWLARVEVEYQGLTFARSKGFGPDATQYTHGWRDVTPDEELA